MQKRRSKIYFKTRAKDLHDASKDSQKATQKYQHDDKHFNRTIFGKIKEWFKNNLDRDLLEYYKEEEKWKIWL